MGKIDEIKKRLVFKVKDASNTNTIFDTRKYLLYDDVIEILNEVLNIPIVVSSKNKPKRTLGDFDVWYKPCTRCGYDTAKSTKPKEGNKTCWKCGNFVQRDYTDRTLKK